jgi:hypothetical protein
MPVNVSALCRRFVLWIAVVLVDLAQLAPVHDRGRPSRVFCFQD